MRLMRTILTLAAMAVVAAVIAPGVAPLISYDGCHQDNCGDRCRASCACSDVCKCAVVQIHNVGPKLASTPRAIERVLFSPYVCITDVFRPPNALS